MIEDNPKIVKLLEKMAKQNVSLRDSTKLLYRLALGVWCPDYQERVATKTMDSDFMDRIYEMEQDIKRSLKERKFNLKVVVGYIDGCFQETVLGVENASLQHLSRAKRVELVTRIQKGEDPDDARKEITSKKDRSLVPVKYFSFPPIGRTEKPNVYLHQASLAWVAYLKKSGIKAIVEMRVDDPKEAAPKKERKCGNPYG